jgi:hypothetical protein
MERDNESCVVHKGQGRSVHLLTQLLCIPYTPLRSGINSVKITRKITTATRCLYLLFIETSFVGIGHFKVSTQICKHVGS